MVFIELYSLKGLHLLNNEAIKTTEVKSKLLGWSVGALSDSLEPNIFLNESGIFLRSWF